MRIYPSKMETKYEHYKTVLVNLIISLYTKCIRKGENMLLKIWNFLKGKKTYLFALAGLVWGIHTGNTEVILTALVSAGLRQGISTEIANIATGK